MNHNISSRCFFIFNLFFFGLKYNYFEDRKNEKHINSVSTNIDGKQISDNPIYSDVTNYGQRISDKTSVHFLSFTATDPDSGGDALHSAASAKRPTTAAHDENDAIDTTPQTDKQKREDRATINIVVGDVLYYSTEQYCRFFALDLIIDYFGWKGFFFLY